MSTPRPSNGTPPCSSSAACATSTPTPGGYDQVRRYVGQHRRDHRETFIPLAHDPGQRLECDFGHIHVDFPDGRRLVPVLVAAWAYSNYPFAVALPTERTEAILAGMVAAFAFFGCVPREVWWDNPTTVVSQIFKGRERRPNERYAALASHYTFEPLFCLPARGNEKPRAENRVQGAATPVGHAGAARRRPGRAQRPPAACCVDEVERTVAGHARVDRPAFRPRPGQRPAVAGAALRRLRLRRRRRWTSTRRCASTATATACRGRCAFRAVTVKGYIDRVEVVAAGQVVARHGRSYGRDEQVLDPLHYLAALGRRPAALDHAPVLRDWQLPDGVHARCGRPWKRSTARGRAARHYIRVLQLLGEHPAGARPSGGRELPGPGASCTAERIARRRRRPRSAARAAGAVAGTVTPLCQYQVPRPDLGRFDQLLSQGDSEDGR